MSDAETKKTADAIATDITSLKLSPETQAAMEKYGPYLDELRKKLYTVLAVFFAFFILGAVLYKQILVFIMGRFNLEGINIVMTSPYQFMSLAIQIGAFTGLLIAIPLLIWYLIQFLRPGLEDGEFKQIVSLLPLSFFLFLLGFVTGTTLMNAVIGLFTRASNVMNIQNIWDIGLFFSQTLFMGMAMALAFQLPIALILLMRFHVLEASQLRKYRPHFYVGILIYAILMPPTDLISLMVLTLPLFLLFELTLLLNREHWN